MLFFLSYGYYAISRIKFGSYIHIYLDLTSCYTRVKDVPVTPLKPVSVTYGYLGVFNDLKWEPVAYAGLREGRFLFKDVGCDAFFDQQIFFFVGHDKTFLSV